MLGGVRKLIAVMGENDQLMLYTTAGATECVLPATSDKDLMYKALAHIQQAEGSMDTAQLVSAVYSEIQSDYQALAPRKAAMIVTDAGQVLSNMALFMVYSFYFLFVGSKRIVFNSLQTVVYYSK